MDRHSFVVTKIELSAINAHPKEIKIKQSGDVDLVLPVSKCDQGGNSVSLSLACIAGCRAGTVQMQPWCADAVQ